MRYTIPVVVVVILLFTLIGCKPTKDDYRRDFVKGCVNRYAKDSTVASTEGRKMVETYCNCMGDQLNAKMDADQWRTFNKSNDTLLTQFQEALQPCIDNFQKNLSTLKPESAGN